LPPASAGSAPAAAARSAFILNLFWIAALAILVLLEKVLPFGRLLARLAGMAFVVGGAWLLLRSGQFR
jgi:predicted metal-binding membrane protein